MIHYLPKPPRAVVLFSLAFPAYYTALSFWLAARAAPERRK